MTFYEAGKGIWCLCCSKGKLKVSQFLKINKCFVAETNSESNEIAPVLEEEQTESKGKIYLHKIKTKPHILSRER